jgi:hypothetical protein
MRRLPGTDGLFNQVVTASVDPKDVKCKDWLRRTIKINPKEELYIAAGWQLWEQNDTAGMEGN